jgi:pyrroloquinoline quinone (PQQ) biosynthesis protein C
MNSLEARLDSEVIAYLTKVEDMPEVKALLSGSISKPDYIRFLKAFYIIEYISQKAVNLASKMFKDVNPYLSKRFQVCAKGELGHAEIALQDLEELGVTQVDMSEISIASEYDDLLQDCAQEFPLGILGHSYLFENASGVLFPKHNPLDFPSNFIEVHAKEDPGHSIAIKRTVHHIENDIDEEQQNRIIAFANKSGDYLLKVLDSLS